MNTEDFKKLLLDYLVQEKDLIESDIARHASLTDEQKDEEGLMVRDAVVVSTWGNNCYDLQANTNNTRLRPGDKVILSNSNCRFKVNVIENGINIISIHSERLLHLEDVYNLEICEAYLLDSLHTVLERCNIGTPGYAFLSQLAQETPIESKGMFAYAETTIANYQGNLNSGQWNCCKMISQNPSICCLQGPPGTGKTRTLAAVVNMLSSQGQQVLVMAYTHQAVNNALNLIRKANTNTPVIKIGDAAKAVKLDDTIAVHPSMYAYSKSLYVNGNGKSKRSKSPKGLVIGMTFHAAVINFGLQHPGFVFPTYVFLDEASQMPLPYASVLGSFGAGSICLFGDSRQMPPIFHPNLVGNNLSVSILDFCSDILKTPSTTLTTTYRMNWVITDFVSRKFYEPHGVLLQTANNNLAGPDALTWCDTLSLPGAIDTYSDDNPAEADEIAREIAELLKSGVKYSDIAVITPYRKQVIRLRQALFNIGLSSKNMPLVDTVERLQGQDVDRIYLSFATTVCLSQLSVEQCNFLLNPNRLNVMISRARSFVRVFSTEEVWLCLNQ